MTRQQAKACNKKLIANYPKFTINKQKKALSAKIKSNAETYQNIEWHWNNNVLEKIDLFLIDWN